MTQLVFFMLLSLVLLVIDHRYNYFSYVRSWLAVVTTPVYWLADLPSRAVDVASEAVVSRSELVEENMRLKAKNLILEQKMQKLASLTAQNIRLKELLNSADLVDEQVVVAEIVGVDADPFSNVVMINKGSADGVFQGQAILDARGVMGQVIEVTLVSSRVMLVTDSASRVPAQNHRTGYRAIAAGTGLPDQLELLHIPDTADFKEGDLLTSSGLGQSFPAGYLLGTVQKVVRTPGQSFSTVLIQPAALVNRSRLVLLVFKGDRVSDLSQGERL